MMEDTMKEKTPEGAWEENCEAIDVGKDTVKENMPTCCCSTDGRHKHKPRTPEEIRSLTNRLNRIEGQINGIKKMIEDNRTPLKRSSSPPTSSPVLSMTSVKETIKLSTSSASS